MVVDELFVDVFHSIDRVSCNGSEEGWICVIELRMGLVFNSMGIYRI